MIAIFPELLGLAATRDVEAMAEAVTTIFAPHLKDSPPRNFDFLDHLRKQVGIGFHSLGNCSNPCILASDDSGSFRVTILANCSIMQLPTFTIAHLIGHFFMDLQLDISRGGRLQKGFRETTAPAQRYLNTALLGHGNVETVADAFAAALLVPKGKLIGDFAKGRSQIELATSLEVDPLLLKKRLQQLSMNHEEPQNFAAAEDLLTSKQRQGIQRFGASPALTKQPVPANNPATGPQEDRSHKRGMDRLREIAAQLGSRPSSK